MNREQFDAFVDRAIADAYDPERECETELKSLWRYLCMWEPFSQMKDLVVAQMQRVVDIQGVGRPVLKNRLWKLYEDECLKGYVPREICP